METEHQGAKRECCRNSLDDSYNLVSSKFTVNPATEALGDAYARV